MLQKFFDCFIFSAILLTNQVYTPVMNWEKVIRQAIDDALTLSNNKVKELVTPRAGIVEAFRDKRLKLGNRIKIKTP